MMICKADFQELFPDLFAVDPVDRLHPKPDVLAKGGLARWGNDGGQSGPLTAPRGQESQAVSFGGGIGAIPNPAVAHWAQAPILVAFGVFWARFADIGFG